VAGLWLTFRGEPFPDAPAPSAPVRVAAAGELPVAYVRVPFTAPDGLGDFALELDLFADDGRPVRPGGPPVRVPVHVTGRAADAMDYEKVYATADLARDYWTVVGPPTPEEFARLSLVKLDLLVKLGLTPHSRLLDVGCGTGLLAAAAEGFLADDGAYHGTDVAEPAVRFCRGKFRRPNFSFSRNEPTRIGATGAFDAVAFYSVFTHTYPDETAALLRDAAGLLAPGGFAFADAFVSPLVRDHAGHRGAVEVNPDRLRDLIAAVPLRSEEVMTEPWGRYATRVFLKMTRP
jgi:SAM-dependent methyltransferase